jgi:hypothetical protein
MAQPIKPTPVLYGNDAVRFETRMQNPKLLSQRERKEQSRAFELAKSRATFAL